MLPFPFKIFNDKIKIVWRKMFYSTVQTTKWVYWVVPLEFCEFWSLSYWMIFSIFISHLFHSNVLNSQTEQLKNIHIGSTQLRRSCAKWMKTLQGSKIITEYFNKYISHWKIIFIIMILSICKWERICDMTNAADFNKDFCETFLFTI